MRYIYYIIAIVLVFSGLAAYGLFDASIEVSQPVLSVNDRIYSQSELESLMNYNHADQTRDEFVDSLIEKQLLIQEAIRQKINSEESFRRSVENFYEQSLIKILLDRKHDSLAVDVTTEEVARYEELTRKKIIIKKLIYPTMADLKNRSNEKVETIETEYINLSDDLKFSLLSMNPGESTPPGMKGGQGAVMYRLEKILPADPKLTSKMKPFDVKRVSLFIQGMKKEQLLDQWIKEIRQSADIWRKN